MSVSIEWNDAGLKKIFDSLDSKVQQKFHTTAMRTTANKIAKMVKSDASNKGLGSTGEVEKNGWHWVRYGRVPRSVTAGKLWARGTKQTVRVFNRGSKRAGFASSAPHAHLVILGHRKFIPNGKKGKGQGRWFAKTQGDPIYQAAFQNSDVLFEREIELSVSRMIKKLNKQGKL